MTSEVRLLLGDCLELMRDLPDGSIDAVVTDPPYGNGTAYNSYDDSREHLALLVPGFLRESMRMASLIAITSGVANMWLYPSPSWVLAWVNSAGVGSSVWGFSCCCLLYTSDAADDLLCVDLGGRRIIKKKIRTRKATPSDINKQYTHRT